MCVKCARRRNPQLCSGSEAGGGGVQSSGDLPFCAEVGFDRRGTCVIAHGRALTWTFLGAAVTAVCVCLGGWGVVTHSFSFKNHQFLGYLLGGGGFSEVQLTPGRFDRAVHPAV